MSDDSAKELVAIKKLLAVIATKGESRRDQVLILSNAGFSPSDIAAFVGTTANTVSVILYQTKKRSTRKK